MKRLHLTAPLALAALAVWLLLTLGGQWLQAGSGQHSLADAAGGGIGVGWLLAAGFAAIVALASRDRRAAGLFAPAPMRSARLVWLPLLYALLMLLVAWADGWPARGVLLLVACNTALVALSEELMFRAVLLQGFLDRFAIWPAVFLSSVVFGAVHAANGFASGDAGAALVQSVSAFLQGLAYSAIRLRTRSIWPMVLVHGLWDFSLMSSMLSASSGGDDSVLPYAALFAVLPMCLYGLYLMRAVRGHAMPGMAAPAT
ncbi:CPBP family intramembrane glutamic endopeptidase [Massilia sp. CCM 8734]|uniref:CPBP family intramembrane glutamic endopeptidase n=1 Tax=Massilia sp. CCM 8734 TaxID=2609283 RepID=UPI0014242597|nr:CPBP family intramembrane glutamic endopeptidase [Massilia sp. CCM 8734]NIA00307.1 CPBP family intramembrane metalloprotease [Massilia sp. CCM 8734]